MTINLKVKKSATCAVDIQNIAFNIDIICAHSSPTYIKPVNTSVIDQGSIVNNWSIWDSKLKQDNWDDRHTLDDIYECTSYKDISLIRQILRLHEEFYSSVVDNREKPQRLFVCALNATRYLYSLTGGYVYD